MDLLMEVVVVTFRFTIRTISIHHKILDIFYHFVTGEFWRGILALSLDIVRPATEKYDLKGQLNSGTQL